MFVVHGLPSSGQSAGFGVPTQVPAPLHVSFCVHAAPSLHGSVLLVWVQPTPGVHVSVVQRFGSAQAPLFGVLTHEPFTQASDVHAMPSVQERALLLANEHPTVVQVLVVQGFPSSHLALFRE